LRISSSLAWLLGEGADGRQATRREVGRLYGLRSDVVHGNRPLEPTEAAEARSSALRLTLEALRRLIANRADLLACKNSEERSNRLIVDA
jgi:hypothetical protein